MKNYGVIFDLDGTLCDFTHRKHIIPESQYTDRNARWKDFYDECINDKPYEWCLKLIHSISYDLDIIFLTSRNEYARQATELWLKRYNLPTDYLFMRPDDNFLTSSCELKIDIYKEQIEPYWNTLFVVDDLLDVINAFNRIGVRGLYCGACA